MLSIQPRSPADERHCSQTVTLYHVQAGPGGSRQYRRTVVEGVFFEYRKSHSADKTGGSEANSFLLVLPQRVGAPVYLLPGAYAAQAEQGAAYTLCPLDKVLLGSGPEVTTREGWAELVPTRVDGLVVVKDIAPNYWRGKICHVEVSG